jgi:DNA-binding CsgD family transcriptional regulator
VAGVTGRGPGAGPDHALPFVGRVVAALVILRFRLPHAAFGVLYRVDRSTITRAVHEICPLLAQRGFAVSERPGTWLGTLADVFAYAAAEGAELRIDGTEVQVRRPAAHKPGRRAFVSGKKKQNTMKPTVISDGDGRLLWTGLIRPGRMHDVSALRTEGIEDLLSRRPDVKPGWTRGTGAWPVTSPGRSPPRPRSRARTPLPRRPPPASRPATSSPRSESASSPALAEPLTDRELQVLALLAAGIPNQQIASELVVALETAKKHVSHILGKLGAANRTQAVARARALGLLQ